MNLNHEVSGALQMMKFANNHPWKFRYPTLAYFAGLFQLISTVLTAIICYFVIISSPDVLELAKDFTALMIISEFDNQFAMFSREKIAKEAVKITDTDTTYRDLFMIETTTSRDAQGSGNSILKEDEDEAWKLIEEKAWWNEYVALNTPEEPK